MTQHFLDFQKEFILDQFPTYTAWAEAISMFMLNSVCPNAMLPGGGMGIPLALNFLGIGPSRIGFKSTPLNHITKPVLRRVGVYLLPPKFTVEGMYDYLTDGTHKKTQNAVLIRDEASGLVVETRKQYLADELTFLTELVDGEITPRKTVTHGYQKPRKIRVLFICCGTPHLFTLIDQGFWVQGLGNRLIPIYWMEPTSTIPFVLHELDFESRLRKSAKILKEYQQTDVRLVQPNEEIKKLFQTEEWVRRRAGWDGYSDDKMDIAPAIYYECNVFIKKVAGIRAIDRQKGEKNPIIEKEDFAWAKSWVEKRYEELEEMYKDMLNIQLRQKSGTLYQPPGLKILRALKRHPEGLTNTDLNNKTRLSAKTRKEALAKLIAEGMVIEEKKWMNGRWKTYYKFKE